MLSLHGYLTVAGEMTTFSFQKDVINHLALVDGRSYGDYRY
jgi:hypothetical protein